MDADRWIKAKDIFAAALERPPDAREDFVRSACAGDRLLQDEVVSLLAAYDSSDGLSTPPWQAASPKGAIEGRAIGPYRMIRKLGEGGMGQVWLAEQTEPVRREVALKLIRIGIYDAAVLRRFEAERQSLAIMNHPAIAKVLDAGATPDGQPYFAMEYVQGLPITRYCAERGLDIKERLELFLAACDGVQHAHQKAIIHRDLKPANILVVDIDGRPMPRIIDFGLAKPATSGGTDEMLTRVGTFVGTPGYMSPEQADPSKDVDTRTDVYALGAILYELLTGALPFDAHAKRPVEETLKRLAQEDPEPPSRKIPALHGDVDAITMKALERDRERRYGSPAELADDVRRYLQNEPVTARAGNRAYRLQKYVRRHRVAMSVAAVVALLLTTAAVVEAVQLRRITRERDRANRITEFMTTMFRVADPSERRGNSITARELLDKAARDIDTGLAQDPRLQAQMMDVMGTVYSSLGVYSGAEPLLKRAVDIWTRTAGPDDPNTLSAAHNLADTLGRRGRYADAEKLERRTYETLRRVLGPGDAATLRSMASLAVTLDNSGRLREAEWVDREAVGIARRTLGADHPDLLRPLNSLGTVLQREGHYAEAEKYHTEALTRRRRALGSDHPLTLISLQGLAGDFRGEGRYVDAEKIDREILEARMRLFGEGHQQTISARIDIARDLSRQRRYAEAEQFNRESLEISRRSLGEDFTDTVSVMINLAENLQQQGRFGESEALNRRAIDVNRRQLGPDHLYTLVPVVNLAIDLVRQGRPRDAEPLARDALERSSRRLGREHPNTINSMNVLVSILSAEGRYSDAEELNREEIELARRAFGADDAQTADAEYELATVLALAGKRDEAIATLRGAVERLSREKLIELPADVELKSLGGDPRFRAIAAEAKQRAAGTEKAARTASGPGTPD